MIGFEDLRDDGISVMKGRHYDGEEGFYAHVRYLAEGYETDKLARQDVDIRVYCEAAGMMPQLLQDLRPVLGARLLVLGLRLPDRETRPRS